MRLSSECSANPDFNSLNLAQAVLLVSYEWIKVARLGEAPSLLEPTGDSEWADHEELAHYLKRLNEALDISGFYRNREMKTSVWQNVQNMFTRQRWTSQEVQTLHGILTALRQNDDCR